MTEKGQGARARIGEEVAFGKYFGYTLAEIKTITKSLSDNCRCIVGGSRILVNEI
jgi:hypothetical protein